MSRPNALLPLLDEHDRLDSLLLAHQTDLVSARPRESGAALGRFRAALLGHMAAEESLVLPEYAARCTPGKGGEVRYFRAEHLKLRRLIEEGRLWMAAWAGRSWPAREVVFLIEREKLFKEVLEHHGEREAEILYPALARALTDTEAATLVESFRAAALAEENRLLEEVPPNHWTAALATACGWLEPVLASLASGGERPRREAAWGKALETVRQVRDECGGPEAGQAAQARDVAAASGIMRLLDLLEESTPFAAFPAARAAEVRAAWHLLGAAHRALAATVENASGRPVLLAAGSATEGGTPDASAGYRIVAHTADFGIAGTAGTLQGIFTVMARGLFSLICDLDGVEVWLSRKLVIEADSPLDLLHGWLRELNGLHHQHGEIYTRFEVVIDDCRLEGVASGEPMDPERHALHHEIKGITWHDFVLEKGPSGYRAHVLVDT